jgi:hypothetical protein
MSDVKKIQSLEASLEDMHALASGSLARIRGMARCALRALESPRGAGDIESIAEVLQAIAQDAEMTHNDVSVEAERQGIKTIDDAWMRRLQAMPKAPVQGGAV